MKMVDSRVVLRTDCDWGLVIAEVGRSSAAPLRFVVRG